MSLSIDVINLSIRRYERDIIFSEKNVNQALQRANHRKI